MQWKNMSRGLRAALLALVAAGLGVSSAAFGQSQQFLPPWTTPPQGGVHFAVPPVNAISDLHGDIVNPQLVVFFAGNQFMVAHDLIAGFRQAYPKYQRIYVETLPPGIAAKQIETGALVMGNLKIELRPDIYTAGKSRVMNVQKQHGWFAKTVDYARNSLAIMVPKGNPKNVRGLKDLGRPDVRVSMPNPEWEGIGKHIEAAYRKAGGEALVTAVMKTKLADGTTYLTRMHHRQSPLRILQGKADAAPVWKTEPYFQQHVLNNPVATVAIPADQNVVVTYTAALMKTAPHPQAARDFMKFMTSKQGQAIYRKYGFDPPR